MQEDCRDNFTDGGKYGDKTGYEDSINFVPTPMVERLDPYNPAHVATASQVLGYDIKPGSQGEVVATPNSLHNLSSSVLAVVWRFLSGNTNKSEDVAKASGKKAKGDDKEEEESKSKGEPRPKIVDLATQGTPHSSQEYTTQEKINFLLQMRTQTDNQQKILEIQKEIEKLSNK